MSQVKHELAMPMWGSSNQDASTGCVTVSRTSHDELGESDARLELATELFERIRNGASPSNYVQAIEDLSVDKLGVAISVLVVGISPFDGPLEDESAIEQRLFDLNFLEAERTGSLTRETLAVVASVATERLDRFRGETRMAIEAKPADAAMVTADCRTHLATLDAATVPPTHLAAFSAVVKRLRDLPEYEDRLPSDTFAAVHLALLQKARELAHAALNEIVGRKAARYVQSHRPQLDSYLATLDRFATRFAEQRKNFVEHYEEQTREVAQRQADLQSSLAVTIYGPNKDEVLSGCRAATGTADLVALIGTLLERFDAGIRSYAQVYHPQLESANASLATLVADLPTSALIDVFDRTLNQIATHQHSVFASIRSTGVAQTVEQLWHRAAPTTFNGVVDDFRCGLSSSELAIVRLPAPTNVDDVQTEQDIREAFHATFPLIRFVSSEFVREILVARVLQGFLMALESANAALLQRYRLAVKLKHFPHLIGLFPDAMNGKPIPGCVSLSNHLKPQNPRSKRNGNHNGTH